MENIAEILEGVKTMGIGGHIRPDGDCVGSCMALYLYVKTYYPEIQVDVYLDNPKPVFGHIDCMDEIKTELDGDKEYDLFVTCDVSARDRLALAGPYFDSAKKTACIDHHISNPGFAQVNHIRGDVSSACEVLYGLLDPEKVNCTIAKPVYTGMVHDTGVFQYSNVTPDTLTRAAKLIAFGIPFTDLIQKTFYEKGFNEARASAYAISKAAQLLDGFFVWSYMTIKEMERFQITSAELDSVVSELRNIRGVDTAVFLYEIESGVWKCSFRSNHVVNVSELAVSFGGGGHVRASGCTFDHQEPDEIITEIINRIPKEDYAGRAL